MGSFRRVEGETAGPEALGILVPPSRRTFVILRPRHLPWDLLLCRSAEDLAFRDLAHDEASAAAQGLYRSLNGQTAGSVVIEVVETAEGCRLRAMVGSFPLAVCLRVPGQPYALLVCPPGEASAICERLLTVLRPVAGEERELYFNVRFFDRPAG